MTVSSKTKYLLSHIFTQVHSPCIWTKAQNFENLAQKNKTHFFMEMPLYLLITLFTYHLLPNFHKYIHQTLLAFLYIVEDFFTYFLAQSFCYLLYPKKKYQFEPLTNIYNWVIKKQSHGHKLNTRFCSINNLLNIEYVIPIINSLLNDSRQQITYIKKKSRTWCFRWSFWCSTHQPAR